MTAEADPAMSGHAGVEVRFGNESGVRRPAKTPVCDRGRLRGSAGRAAVCGAAGEVAEDAILEGAVRLVQVADLTCGGMHLTDLAGKLRAELAHHEMKPQFQAAAPRKQLHLIGGKGTGHVFARDHDFRQPFNLRHSRRRILALCMSTP